MCYISVFSFDFIIRNGLWLDYAKSLILYGNPRLTLFLTIIFTEINQLHNTHRGNLHIYKNTGDLKIQFNHYIKDDLIDDYSVQSIF